MTAFRIYYGDGSVYDGSSKEDWIAAPSENVQVVVLLVPWPEPPYPNAMETGWVGCARRDRQFYTGVDQFDPLGTGQPKRGKLLPDEQYWKMWEEAYGNYDS